MGRGSLQCGGRPSGCRVKSFNELPCGGNPPGMASWGGKVGRACDFFLTTTIEPRYGVLFI